MLRATSSLPVPLSPVMRTVVRLFCRLAMVLLDRHHSFGLEPIIRLRFPLGEAPWTSVWPLDWRRARARVTRAFSLLVLPGLGKEVESSFMDGLDGRFEGAEARQQDGVHTQGLGRLQQIQPVFLGFQVDVGQQQVEGFLCTERNGPVRGWWLW